MIEIDIRSRGCLGERQMAEGYCGRYLDTTPPFQIEVKIHLHSIVAHYSCHYAPDSFISMENPQYLLELRVVNLSCRRQMLRAQLMTLMRSETTRPPTTPPTMVTIAPQLGQRDVAREMSLRGQVRTCPRGNQSCAHNPAGPTRLVPVDIAVLVFRRG